MTLGYCFTVANSSDTRDNLVNSVERAVSILQVLAHRGPTTITQISTELSIHKSTVFRLLSTLEARGLVDQNTSRGRYQLGYGVVQLAAGATRKLDLSVISRPICEALAEAIGETVNVAVHDGDAVVSIDQVIGSAAMTSVNWVGQRDPLHAASAGKVFLAYMTAEERADALPEKLKRFTERTITSREALEAQLEDVRQQGYAFTMEEREIGLAAVAAPIRALDGGVVAALAISGPTFRINPDTIPEMAQQVVVAAIQISQRNGLPKPG